MTAGQAKPEARRQGSGSNRACAIRRPAKIRGRADRRKYTRKSLADIVAPAYKSRCTQSCAADAMFSTQNEPQAEEICYNIFMLDFERLADEYRILSYLVTCARRAREVLRRGRSSGTASQPLALRLQISCPGVGLTPKARRSHLDGR